MSKRNDQTTARAAFSRREIIKIIGALGLPTLSLGCGDPNAQAQPQPRPDAGAPPDAQAARARYRDNVAALMDVLIPAERDARGAVTSPGALEAGAEQVLELANLVHLLRGQGLLPPLPASFTDGLDGFDGALRALVNADLDVLAFAQAPLTPFRRLAREQMERAVQAGFDDPLRRPVFELVRTACFVAYLGAVTSDVGLRAIGYDPFEDFAGGVYVSGYPRRRADGSMDDYTYNRAPAATPGDDLSGVLDADGELR
ncbi:MAG: hypothetical protein KC503_04175 [Myxococcales bacterium]|nr:hypothetical protein [Myxococcales bacterium]